jgi:uncharacterized protein (DUF4415 family)
MSGDGLMNAMEDEAFDYQAYLRETPPDPAKIRRGTAARRQRFDAARKRLTVRSDEELLQHFSQLDNEDAEGKSRDQLINQVLREWLSAIGMKEMLHAEIQLAVQQSLASAQRGTEAPPA